jgi:hypothetical protein
MPILPTRVLILLSALLLSLLASPLRAQSPTPTPSTGTKTAALAVEVESPGVGGFARAGGMVGVRVRLTDTSLARRNVAVRLTIRDVDGDYFTPARLVPLTPGVATPVWVYAWLPADAVARSMVLGVYPVREDAGLEGARLDEPLARIELGDAASTSGRALTIVEPNTSFLLKVGTRSAGLTRYTTTLGSNNSRMLVQEPVQVLDVRTLAELPDSWLGLAPISTIVWTQGEPGELRGAYAQALREWILRGGHLVVILPSAGQTWIGPGLHELSDLMPEVEVRRRDGADLSPYRPLLTRTTARIPPEALKGVVHELAPVPGVVQTKAIPILTGPAGECVVVRRLAGSGAVTVIGLDLTRQNAMEPDADLFWHRVLGTRGQLLTAAESANMQISSSPSTVVLDAPFPSSISSSESVAMGVFLGLVVFAAYWALAGPIAYAVLKRLGLVHYSWLAYVVMAGLFTLIAWGGATAIKPGKTEANHLTLYEHVHGQPYSRTRTFMNAMLPWYGDARIGLGGTDGKLEVGGTREFRNAVAPWSTDFNAAARDAAFPDTRPYVMDVTNPSSLSFPARSTEKTLQADWLGGTLWRTPQPITDAGELGGELAIGPDGRLQGRLRHELPAELTNVEILYVPGQRSIRADPSNPPKITEGVQLIPFGGWVLSLGNKPWAAGETLDLAALDAEARKSPGETSLVLNLDRLVQSARSGFNIVEEGTRLTRGQRWLLVTALGQLPAPQYDGTRLSNDQIFQAARRHTHGWDSSRWFTQPCVMVLGEISGESPTPLFVDGEPLASRGTTLVRWIYPLAANPPAWGAVQDKPADGAGGVADGAADGVEKK